MTPLPTTAAAEPASIPSSPGRQRELTVLVAGFFLVLWFVLCWHLGAEWTINEQYNYGWFVPFFALYLFWTRWERRPQPSPPSQEQRIRFCLLAGGTALLLVFPLRLFEVGNPDWRLLGWLHAALAAALSFLALWCAGGKPWVRYFAFPILFFFIAVPWLLSFEIPLVQGLMRIVAIGATESITLCGIPAEVDGNLIRVNAGVVGVNEACSGVRSLQTALMIGLLFGDLCRLSISRRIWLVLGALAIAVLANFGRAFFLVWIVAAEGLPALDRWHDFAGYSILAAVCLGSILLAAWLRRRQGSEPATPGPSAVSEASEAVAPSMPSQKKFPARLVLGGLCGLIVVEIGVEAWYRLHERNLVSQTPWTVHWPAPAPDVRSTPIDERVKRFLRYDEGGQASWPIAMPSDPAARALLYFFRWDAGSTSVARARSHRPDICLPSTGWRLAADHGLRKYQAENFSFPFRHYSFVHDLPEQPAVFAHAFFCVHEARVRPTAEGTQADPTAMTVTRWMIAERARIVADGLRNPGQQVLELIFTSRKEIPAPEAEAKFAEMLPSLVRIGDGDSRSLTSR